MHFHANDGWDTKLKTWIGQLSDLIKQLAAMLTKFVDGFKQVPAAGSENPPAIPDMDD